MKKVISKQILNQSTNIYLTIINFNQTRSTNLAN